MTLSDKINTAFGNPSQIGYIKAEDVKEAVKELKSEINKKQLINPKAKHEGQMNTGLIRLSKLLPLIEDIFGKELTE